MRGDGDKARRPGALTRASARWTAVPVVARMAVRSMTRDLRRTVATMLGTVLALVLILASVGMATSMRAVMDVQFGQVEHADATVLAAAGDADLPSQLPLIPRIAAVEPELVAPVTVSAGTATYSTELTGFRPGTAMHGFRTVAGAAGLPGDGVVAGSALATRLKVQVGDMLTVTPAFGTPQQVRLAALVDEPIGTLLYATESTTARLAPGAAHGYLLRFEPGADRDTIRAAVTRLPGVLAYTDTHALRTEFDRFLALFWAFIAVMICAGTILAFTVIYVTMTVTLADRTTELATLRAAGVPVRRLTAIIATESLTATLVATPFGLVAGIGAAWAFLRTFTSDMFTMHLSVGVVAPALSVLAVLAAAVMSQLPARRFIQHIDIARVVRERAQ